MNVKIALVIILVILTPAYPSMNAINNQEKQFMHNILDGGKLEEIDGVRVLFVSGTNYEMGYQHGFLLRDEANENIRAMLSSCNVPKQKLLEMWNESKGYIPEEYVQELHGLADGANLAFEDVAAAYMCISTWGMDCFGVAAWGNATIDGRLYQFRSFDLPMNIEDPVTGKFMHENSVVIIRKPKNGYASITASVAGSLHGGGGFNEKGIAVGMQACWSNDVTMAGTPAVFRVEMVLDHASNWEDGIRYLISNTTAGWTFILSDAKVPIGFAVETTAHHTYAGTWNSSVESIPPFWSIKDVVRRTNFFISPSMAKTQRIHYDPSGIKGFMRLVFKKDPFFAIWRSYKAMSIAIEKSYGSIDLNSSMELFQKVYRGDTDALLKIIIKLARGTSFNRAWNMWMACPETGDIVISFAERDKMASATPYHYFNLYRLLGG